MVDKLCYFCGHPPKSDIDGNIGCPECTLFMHRSLWNGSSRRSPKPPIDYRLLSELTKDFWDKKEYTDNNWNKYLNIICNTFVQNPYIPLDNKNIKIFLEKLPKSCFNDLTHVSKIICDNFYKKEM